MKNACDCDQIVTPVAGGCTALACTWKVEEVEVAYGSPTSATGLNHGAEAHTKSGSCLFSYWALVWRRHTPNVKRRGVWLRQTWACESRNEYF